MSILFLIRFAIKFEIPLHDNLYIPLIHTVDDVQHGWLVEAGRGEGERDNLASFLGLGSKLQLKLKEEMKDNLMIPDKL